MNYQASFAVHLRRQGKNLATQTYILIHIICKMGERKVEVILE